MPTKKPQLKKQMTVPEGGIDADTVKLRRVKKYTKDARVKHKEQLSELLAQDPSINATKLAKRIRIGRTVLLKYISELREEGDPGAIERIERYQAWRDNARKAQQTVLEYWQKFEYSSDKEVAEALELPLRDVQKHKRALLKKDPGCVKSQKVSMQDANIKLIVAEYYKKNPLATQTQASQALGVSPKTVSRHCVELTDTIQAEAAEVFGLVSSWYAEELMRVIQQCDKKLGQIKVATHGTRWVELKLQAMKMLAKKFKIEQPDVNLNLNVDIGKEERDAAADALIKSMELSSGLKLVEPMKQIEGNVSALAEDDEVIDI